MASTSILDKYAIIASDPSALGYQPTPDGSWIKVDGDGNLIDRLTPQDIATAQATLAQKLPSGIAPNTIVMQNGVPTIDGMIATPTVLEQLGYRYNENNGNYQNSLGNVVTSDVYGKAYQAAQHPGDSYVQVKQNGLTGYVPKDSNYTYVQPPDGGASIPVPKGNQSFKVPDALSQSSVWQDVGGHSYGALNDLYTSINSGAYTIQNGTLYTNSGAYQLKQTPGQNVYAVVAPTSSGGTYTIPVAADLSTGKAAMPDQFITTPQAISYTGGSSGSFLGQLANLAAPIAPIITLASIAVPALQPVAAAINTGEAIANNNPLAALASATGIPGVSSGIADVLGSGATASDVASTIQKINSANNLANAVSSGNALGALSSGVGLTGTGSTQIGDTGLTAADALKTANFLQAIGSGDQNAIIAAAASLAKSPTVQNATSSATSPWTTADTGNMNVLPGEGGSSVADTGLTTPTDTVQQLQNAGLTETNPPAAPDFIAQAKAIDPNFDAQAYLSRYGDLQNAFGNDLQAAAEHFINYGQSEGRNPDPAPPPVDYIAQAKAIDPNFNPQTYLANYSDLQNAFGTDLQAAAEHFINYGQNEGRNADTAIGTNPNVDYIAQAKAIDPNFDPKTYLSNYSDLQNAFGTDLQAAAQHFINYGQNEGRNADTSITAPAAAPTDNTAPAVAPTDNAAPTRGIVNQLQDAGLTETTPAPAETAPATPAETAPATPAETAPAQTDTTAPTQDVVNQLRDAGLTETTPAPAETTPAPAETTPAPAETPVAPAETPVDQSQYPVQDLGNVNTNTDFYSAPSDTSTTPQDSGNQTITFDDGSTLTHDANGNVVNYTPAPAGNLPGETPAGGASVGVSGGASTPTPSPAPAPKPTPTPTPAPAATTSNNSTASLLALLGLLDSGTSSGQTTSQPNAADIKSFEQLGFGDLFGPDLFASSNTSTQNQTKKSYADGGAIDELLQILRG
jgi:hypothetical protein